MEEVAYNLNYHQGSQTKENKKFEKTKNWHTYELQFVSRYSILYDIKLIMHNLKTVSTWNNCIGSVVFKSFFVACSPNCVLNQWNWFFESSLLHKFPIIASWLNINLWNESSLVNQSLKSPSFLRLLRNWSRFSRSVSWRGWPSGYHGKIWSAEECIMLCWTQYWKQSKWFLSKRCCYLCSTLR